MLGFTPRNLQLYETACNHKSYQAGVVSNERLEFLGDAILNMVVSAYLYQHYPTSGEGKLSKLRSKLVNRVLLNKMALKLKVDEILNTEMGDTDKPKFIYGNALEAIIGAAYLDRGLRVTTTFIMNKVLEIVHNEVDFLHLEIDYKSKMLEWGHQHQKGIKFKIADKLNENQQYRALVLIEGILSAEGTGDTKKQAAQNAAKNYFDAAQNSNDEPTSSRENND